MSNQVIALENVKMGVLSDVTSYRDFIITTNAMLSCKRTLLTQIGKMGLG